MARHIGDKGISSRRDHHRADSETVQTVSKVDGIRRAHDHQHGKRDIPEAKVRMDVFKEGNA